MDQQRIILESSPWFIVLCLLLAGGLSFLLYQSKHPWSVLWNRVLTGVRFLLLFFILFLLLEPIVKHLQNYFEKPTLIVLHDNSTSIKEVNDSTAIRTFNNRMNALQSKLEEHGYNVRVTNLKGEEGKPIVYDETSTDLHTALRNISNRYEGQAIAGVILPTDGIYNAGLSPAFAAYNFPVYTVGIGDTLERTDLAIRNIAYNKIAYEGNRFPVRVEVLSKNITNENVNVKLFQQGKLLEEHTQKSGNDPLLVFDFTPLAREKGIQRIDVVVEEKQGEFNTRNNRSSVYVEVVEGKKKILLIAPAPHPDIKPIAQVIDKNSNYEFLLHIPGVKEQNLAQLPAQQIDLVIFHQSPDLRGRTQAVFQQFLKSKSSLLFILGQQSDLRLISQSNMPLKFEAPPRDYDQVTPMVNTNFNNFSLSPETISTLADFPPVSVHFGRIRLPLTSTPLLYQRVGSVTTEKPLLAIDQPEGRKVGMMLGEGLWRWRLHEFDRTENTAAFDELFSKLIQYLSTTEDKRKFRSYPIQQEFEDSDPVVFESQVYNDIYEPVYGNTINITLTDEQGKKTNYTYVTSPGNSRYQIGGLKEGIYKYASRTSINNRQEEVRGEFAVVERQSELQNLTADFDLLRRLAANTGGAFYKPSNLEVLEASLTQTKPSTIIHTEETYDALINLKWLFWLFLLLVSLEWFVRKYFGSY